MNNFYYYYYHAYYCYIVSQQYTPKRDNTPDGKINNQTKSVCNSHVHNNIKYAYIYIYIVYTTSLILTLTCASVTLCLLKSSVNISCCYVKISKICKYVTLFLLQLHFFLTRQTYNFTLCALEPN